MRFYIINGRGTINNLYNRSNSGYFLGYADTTGFIIYWNPDQPFLVLRSHHFWFDEYNFCLSIEYKHFSGSLLIQQDPERHVFNTDLLNFIPCELYLTSTTFFNTTILTYEI